MRIFSMEGGFTRVMGRIFDLFVLHVLWLLCSLPLVTIGASTTALYTITLKMVKNEEPYIVRGFWSAFKSNLKQATELWLIVVAVIAVILLNLYICLRADSALLRIPGIFDAALLILAALAALYVFPIQAKYENTVFHALKNAVICSLRYLPYSLAMAAVIAIPVLVTGFAENLFAVMIALWLFFGSSLIALAHSWLLVRVFDHLS